MNRGHLNLLIDLVAGSCLLAMVASGYILYHDHGAALRWWVERLIIPTVVVAIVLLDS
jgi:hypothetical protein